MHEDQLDVSIDMVRSLIDEQFPQWRCLPVTHVTAPGTVNALFRIGDGLGARLPLRGADAAETQRQIEVEVRAARTLLGRIPFPTPEPVALGKPGAGYPLPWSVQTWLAGTTANEDDPALSEPFACDLAELIVALRDLDTAGRTFAGSGRGGRLRDHDEWMDTCFARSAGLLDVPRLRSLWADFRQLPPPRDDVMTHGDLIPGNVLVLDGRLAGVLDVGGLGPADPALDLVGAWHLLDDGPRQVLRDVLACPDDEWERGRAWAFQQSMGAAWYYASSNPTMSRMGVRTLDRLLRTPSG